MLPGGLRKIVPFLVGIAIGGVAVGTFAYVLRDDPVARVRPPEASPSPDVVSPSPSPSPASPSPSPSPGRLTEADRLRMDGIGPINVGMTVDEAEQAAGIRLRINKEQSAACRFAFPVNGPRNLAFMISYRRIIRVDVAPDAGIKTVSGVGVGDSEEDVLRVYGDGIKREPHPYVPEGSYLVYRPAGERRLLLIFETNGKRVTSFRSGLAGPVRAIEGCA